MTMNYRRTVVRGIVPVSEFEKFKRLSLFCRECTVLLSAYLKLVNSWCTVPLFSKFFSCKDKCGMFDQSLSATLECSAVHTYVHLRAELTLREECSIIL